MQARIVAVKDLTLAGAHLAEGQVMATMEFQDQRLAEFFAARLGWSFFRVELDAADIEVGTEPVQHLPAVFDLLGQRDEHGELLEPEPAKALLAGLAKLGVTSIATLAKSDAKAIRGVAGIGAKAGALTRAAKRHLVAARHAALAGFDVIETKGEPVAVVATIDAPGDAPLSVATDSKPPTAKPSRSKKPKS